VTALTDKQRRLREAEQCLYDAHQRLMDAWYVLHPTDPNYDGINRTRGAVDLLRRMTAVARKQAAPEEQEPPQ